MGNLGLSPRKENENGRRKGGCTAGLTCSARSNTHIAMAAEQEPSMAMGKLNLKD